MLFAVCADRGSPGSTTAALAMASARGLPAVVVEADPYGGDLALRLRPDGNERHPLPPTPTVLGIAAGRSAQPTPAGPIGMASADRDRRRQLDLWREGSHGLNRTVRVVPGFLTAEQGAVLAWPVLTAALQAQSVPVFADLGRMHSGSPSLPIAAAADALIPVCRADMGSVAHLTGRLEHLVPAIAERNGRPPVVLPVVVADRRHGDRVAGRVADLLGESEVGPALRGVGWLAWDPESVRQLELGEDPWSAPLRKSHLMRSARRVMWLLGMATGLDHAEPDSGNRSRATGKQRGAETAEQRPPVRTPAPPASRQPPAAWAPEIGPPTAGHTAVQAAPTSNAGPPGGTHRDEKSAPTGREC